MTKRLLRKTVVAAGLLLAAWTLAAPAAAPKSVTYLGSYTWPASEHGFGGFSGLELSEDGNRFTLISDRGEVFTGALHRDKGRIAGAGVSASNTLKNPKGEVLRDWRADAEGLALRADGRVFVSFEGAHRVWAYVTQEAAAQLPRPKAFKAFQGNSGIEALAIDAKGHLFAIPERSGALTRPFPVWRYDGKSWSQPFALRRDGGFLPVGADFGPDGLLYVLEREFNGFGFRSRVRRFSVSKNSVLSDETLLETALWTHDNLEGISVWRDGAGHIRLTMISDDNFRSFQRTEFVEYKVNRK